MLGGEAKVIGRTPRVFRAVAVPDAVPPHVLGAHGQASGNAPVQYHLQAIVVVGTPAGFGINLGKPICNRGSVYNAELAHRCTNARTLIVKRIHNHASNFVGDTAQEEISSLATDVG